MPVHRAYDVVSLDAGYTLLRPLREAPVVVSDYLLTLGVAPEQDRLVAAWRRAERFFLDDYLSPSSMTWTSDAAIQRLYEQYYTQLLGDLGVDDGDHFHTRAIIESYSAPDNWTSYEGVVDALRELSQRGYRLGVVSDWGSKLLPILRRLGLTRYLDWVVVSGTMGASKPSPAFYQLAVRRAGVAAHRMVHVGDNYYADVRGARIVGMDAILIDWRGRSWPALDVPLIHHLAELAPLLDRHA